MSLEQVLKSVDESKTIAQDYKEEIKNIISSLVQNYPSINLDFLSSKIDNLKFEEGNIIAFKKIIDYNALSNTIIIGKNQDGYDRKNLLAYSLTKMAFSNGQVPNEKYQAIEAGICSQIANLLVGNEGEKQINQSEVVEVNLISSIIGLDSMEEAFTSKNYDTLDKAISKEPGLIEVIQKMNYAYSSSNATPKISFQDIEKDLIDVFYSRKRDNEKVLSFGSNLITNPNYMNEPDEHKGLNGIADYYLKKDKEYGEYINSLEIVELNPRLGINIGAYRESAQVQLNENLEATTRRI